MILLFFLNKGLHSSIKVWLMSKQSQHFGTSELLFHRFACMLVHLKFLQPFIYVFENSLTHPHRNIEVAKKWDPSIILLDLAYKILE